ncbi:hypothetical protein IAR55_004649 [Kwoniella newhampshirensis]|uniref:Uncharacterized protein n=1 Tax=Kwoniella newhampshirensis TaxID=1651941 RepID=A0AAW0YK53_9TREE
MKSVADSYLIIDHAALETNTYGPEATRSVYRTYAQSHTPRPQDCYQASRSTFDAQVGSTDFASGSGIPGQPLYSTAHPQGSETYQSVAHRVYPNETYPVDHSGVKPASTGLFPNAGYLSSGQDDTIVVEPDSSPGSGASRRQYKVDGMSMSTEEYDSALEEYRKEPAAPVTQSTSQRTSGDTGAKGASRHRTKQHRTNAVSRNYSAGLHERLLGRMESNKAPGGPPPGYLTDNRFDAETKKLLARTWNSAAPTFSHPAEEDTYRGYQSDASRDLIQSQSRQIPEPGLFNIEPSDGEQGPSQSRYRHPSSVRRPHPRSECSESQFVYDSAVDDEPALPPVRAHRSGRERREAAREPARSTGRKGHRRR